MISSYQGLNQPVSISKSVKRLQFSLKYQPQILTFNGSRVQSKQGGKSRFRRSLSCYGGSNLIFELGAVATDTIGRKLTRDALYVSLTWIGVGVLLKLLEKWYQAVMKRAQELNESVEQVEAQERPMVTVLQALYDPLRFFLPFLAILQTGFIAIRTLEHVKSAEVFPSWVASAIERALQATKSVEIITVKLFGILWVVFGVWVALRLRSSIISRAIYVLGAESKEKQENIRRALLPVGTLSGWVLMAVGILLSLDVLGLNLQPVIASLGVGSILLGYAAQSTLSNLLGGVGIFLSQPFVPGDLLRVIGEKGEVLARGTVLEIKPMRTMLKGDQGEVFYVPNNQLIKLILANESPFVGPYSSNISVVPQNTQRRIAQEFQISNLEVAPVIAQKTEDMLNQIDNIDKNLPKGAAITSMNEENNAVLSVWSYSQHSMSDRQLAFLKQQIVLKVGDIIKAESQYSQVSPAS